VVGRQQKLIFSRRGGKRDGAGRSPKGKYGIRHAARIRVKKHEPIHVSLRATKRVGNLRRDAIYAAIRGATTVVSRHLGCRIIHVSIQRTHVHLILEADSGAALTETMRSFEISAARQINRVLGEGGHVFERYRANALTSPSQVRNCLAYVLNNWRHHGEHHRHATAQWTIDKYSSAISFDGWKELGAGTRFAVPANYEPLNVWEPKRWLLRESWRRRGLVGITEMPGGLLIAASAWR
jgi:REP element-mobilizing transposase RayT